MADTMYDRIGGKAGILLAVDDFYRRMTADPALAPYFRGVDMDSLRIHQAMILTMLTGGPNETCWQTLPAIHGLLRRAHTALGLSEDDFDRMAGHLVASLRQLAVADDDIDALAAGLTDFRPDIVTIRPDEVQEDPDQPRGGSVRARS
jgi:hemoglobin